MENIAPFQEVITRCKRLDSQMNTSYRTASPTLEFSNSGRRGGKKYFQIALPSLLQVFIDIKNNLTSFQGNERYNEGSWRNLYGKYLTDPPAHALSTVQTLPLFSALSKIIHAINNLLPEEHNEHVISLDEEHLEITIQYLRTQIADDVETVILQTTDVTKPAEVGENIIFYGAPGTGKSYTVEQMVSSTNTIRTVFHADTQNNDFIGSLKPSLDENRDLTYAFQPGPFTEAYCLALNNPTEHYWLVIEEINRAPASTVFGEIFQLLDRNEDGNGSYQVNVSDPLWAAHLKERISAWDQVLRMPSNLSFFATMNSSDQAVLPMDTAFKRRWKFHYIPLEFEAACAQGSLGLTKDHQEPAVSWKDYAIAVNHILTENHIPEDRHLGPFFLSNSDLNDEYSALTGKLFMYLWDDVLRHGLRHVIFADSIKTYGQLITNYRNAQMVYNPEFLSHFETEGDEPTDSAT